MAGRGPWVGVMTALAVAASLWLVPAAGAETGGYHHLGAVSDTGWTGVVGRLQVRDPGVRAGTYDFVAARFMVKQQLPEGGVAWLEAGWSENGWRTARGQVIYTYDSVTGQWLFHEGYRIRDGDRVWIHLESAAGTADWTAWLWWNGEWRELTTVTLPRGGRAQVEEFVEVHVDGDGAVPVPPIGIDNVQLRAPNGDLTPWRSEVATATADDQGRYCVDWQQPYDTWSAGDC